jgi:hypothetical protein
MTDFPKFALVVAKDETGANVKIDVAVDDVPAGVLRLSARNATYFLRLLDTTDKWLSYWIRKEYGKDHHFFSWKGGLSMKDLLQMHATQVLQRKQD